MYRSRMAVNCSVPAVSRISSIHWFASTSTCGGGGEIPKREEGETGVSGGGMGESGGWEGSHDGVNWRPGLEKIIEMTGEEWDEEINI